ncbi:MAG: ATP-binding protein [Phycisphaerales bacterium]
MSLSPPTIGLDTEALDAAFPFRFTLERVDGSWGRLAGVGPRLFGVAPEAKVGRAFEEIFTVDRAAGGPVLPPLPRSDTQYLLMPKGRGDGFRLRGQFVRVAANASVVFLGAPWVSELDDLARFGLSLKDFPPHESIGDMLLLLQTRNTALAELRSLTDQLREAAKALDERHRRLEEELERRQRLEATLRQVQKMEAIGLLAGGIAHDFNNLMTAILGFASLAAERLPKGTPARDYIDEIQRATERATALTSQLLTFSRRQVMQPRIVDLGEECVQTESILRRLLGAQVRLVAEHRDGPLRVEIDPNALQQIVINLAVNARDAMPDGGTITLRTRADHPAPVGSNGESPRRALLEVVDDGCGMSAETIERIFEPFFTTKPQGKGTGLGLSTVYGIVQQAGGEVTVDSTVGKGTCFRISLPRSESETEQRRAPSERRDAPRVEASVLLVEDEPAILSLLEMALGDAGFVVHAASDPKSAIERSRSLRSIDVLVTDVGLPGMPGPALAEAVRDLHPEVRTLFISGYAPDAAFRRSVGSGEHAFMQKPFTPQQLVDRIADMMQEAGTKETRQPCTE